MKRIRIFLLTLALGLASASLFNWIYDLWTEIPVRLPQVASDQPIVVFPGVPPPGGGGSGGCETTECLENQWQDLKQHKHRKISKLKPKAEIKR